VNVELVLKTEFTGKHIDVLRPILPQAGPTIHGKDGKFPMNLPARDFVLLAPE
jgi:hypothetical protein